MATFLFVLGLGPFAARASTVEIQYALSGTAAFFPRLVPNPTPVFGPDAPGPGGMGSTVTFAFAATPDGDLIHSGDVTMRSFVQSIGFTIPGQVSGYEVLLLTGVPLLGPSGTALPGSIVPLTGGHLSVRTAFGAVEGAAFRTGFVYCYAYCISLSLPGYAPRTIPLGPVNGEPVPFGEWTFNFPEFSRVYARRSIDAPFPFRGYAMLIGSEISRTMIPVPEPSPLAPLLTAVLGLVVARLWSRRRPGASRRAPLPW